MTTLSSLYEEAVEKTSKIVQKVSQQMADGEFVRTSRISSLAAAALKNVDLVFTLLGLPVWTRPFASLQEYCEEGHWNNSIVISLPGCIPIICRILGPDTLDEEALEFIWNSSEDLVLLPEDLSECAYSIVKVIGRDRAGAFVCEEPHDSENQIYTPDKSMEGFETAVYNAYLAYDQANAQFPYNGLGVTLFSYEVTDLASLSWSDIEHLGFNRKNEKREDALKQLGLIRDLHGATSADLRFAIAKTNEGVPVSYEQPLDRGEGVG